MNGYGRPLNICVASVNMVIRVRVSPVTRHKKEARVARVAIAGLENI
jgi:hypothetical protein